MAEARAEVALYRAQRRGFNVALPSMPIPPPARPGVRNYYSSARNDAYYSLTLTLSVPTPLTTLHLFERMVRRLRATVSNRFWPATPATVGTVIASVTALTVFAETESWLRSGWLADVLWRLDELINKVNPLFRFYRDSTPFRVGYLAAMTAFVGMFGIMAAERWMLRTLLHWRGWLEYNHLSAPPSKAHSVPMTFVGDRATRPHPLSDPRKLKLSQALSSRDRFALSMWISAVRMLSGSKNLTYGFQRSLPHLPLPSIAHTCERYIESVRPVSTPEEFAHIQSLCDSFLENEGPGLQRQLYFRWLTTSNYVSAWWEQFVYLRNRSSLLINSNYYVLDPQVLPTTDQAFRAANLAHHMLRFKDMIEAETLQPLTIRGVVPVCMAQYSRLFSTVRVPRRECDELRHFPASRHIVVIRRGRFYCMEVYHNTASRKAHQLYTAAELAHQFQVIMDRSNLDAVDAPAKPTPQSIASKSKTITSTTTSHAGPAGSISFSGTLMPRSHSTGSVFLPPITAHPFSGPVYAALPRQDADLALFTQLPRTAWAEVREAHFAEGLNKESLRMIEEAAFVVHLDADHYGRNVQGRAGSLFHDQHRWLDKSINLVVFEDGHAGLNAEHSWGDAPVVAHLWEHALLSELQAIERGQDAAALAFEPLEGDPLPMPLALEWNWRHDDGLVRALTEAREFAGREVGDLQLVIVEHGTYGKEFVKACGVSPDSYLQLALQLAFFRDRGHFGLTYESAMTRLYREGRTETVRSLTPQVVAFVHAMEDPGAGPEVQAELLHEAARNHSRLNHEAMSGHGIDRHMFALYVVSRAMDVESPFLKEALSAKWRLSTSQQPQVQTSIRASLAPETVAAFHSPGGGFGPVADDGYGVSYMVAGESKFFFHISSKRSNPDTDSARFAGHIQDALTDMAKLFAMSHA